MSSAMDPYLVLGLSKEATDSEVKKAYREMARKYHPDKNDSKDAGETFKNIGAAYEILKDPVKRGEHDMAQKMKSQTTFMSSPRTSFFAYQDSFFTKPFHFNVHNLHQPYYQNYKFHPKPNAQTFVYRNYNNNFSNYSSKTTSPSEEDEHFTDDRSKMNSNYTQGYGTHKQPHSPYVFLNNPFNVMNGFMQFQEPFRLKTIFTNSHFAYTPQPPSAFPRFKQNHRHPSHKQPFHHRAPKPKDSTGKFYGKHYTHKNVIVVDNDEESSDSDESDDDSDEYDNACDDMMKILEEKISKLEGYKYRKSTEKNKPHNNVDETFKNKKPKDEKVKNTFKTNGENPNLQGWYFSSVGDNKSEEFNKTNNAEKHKDKKTTKRFPEPQPSKSPIQFPCFYCHKRVLATLLSAHEKECMEAPRSKSHSKTDAASHNGFDSSSSSKESQSKSSKINEKKSKHEEKSKNFKERNVKTLNEKIKTRDYGGEYNDKTSQNGFKNSFNHFHFNSTHTRDVPPPAPHDPPLHTGRSGSGDSFNAHSFTIIDDTGANKNVLFKDRSKEKNTGYFKAVHITCPACFSIVGYDDHHTCCKSNIDFKNYSDENEDSSGKEKMKKNKENLSDLTRDNGVTSSKMHSKSEKEKELNDKNNNSNNNNINKNNNNVINFFEVPDYHENTSSDDLVKSTVVVGEVMDFDTVEISDEEINDDSFANTTDNNYEISDNSHSKNDNSYGSDDISYNNEENRNRNSCNSYRNNHNQEKSSSKDTDETEEMTEERGNEQEMPFTNFLYLNGHNKPLNLADNTLDDTKDNDDVKKGELSNKDDKKYESVMKNDYFTNKNIKDTFEKPKDAQNTFRKLDSAASKVTTSVYVKHKKVGEVGDDVKSRIFIKSNATITQPEIKKLRNDTKSLADNIKNIEQAKKNSRVNNNENLKKNTTIGKKTTIHIKSNVGMVSTKEVNINNAQIPKLSAMSTKSTLHPHVSSHVPTKFYTKNYEENGSKSQFKNIDVNENSEKNNPGQKSAHNTIKFIKMNKLNYSKKPTSKTEFKPDFKSSKN